MLRFEEIAFGPIHSRRLGSSLGVNLLPVKGKLCNFDCIYCECGWNKDGRQDTVLPSAKQVSEALEAKLTSCLNEGIQIDSITFSGNGEPTLHPEFPQIVDQTIFLRNKYYPAAKISVLSNATMLYRDEVVEALRKTDNPILKIDASSTAGVNLVNKPSGKYELSQVIDNLKSFDGDFILQTMFLRSPFFDSSSEENLKAWIDIVRELRPREVMVYTLDRETPDKSLEKFTVQQMETMTKVLVDEGFCIQIRG